MWKLIFTKLNHLWIKWFLVETTLIRRLRLSCFDVVDRRMRRSQRKAELSLRIIRFNLRHFQSIGFLSRLMSIPLIVMWTFMQCILSILLFVKNISIKR